MSTRISKAKKEAKPAPRTKNRAAMLATGAGVLGVVALGIWAGGKALLPEDSAPAPQPVTTTTPERYVAPEVKPASQPPEEEKLFSESILAAKEQEPEAPEETEEEKPSTIPFELEQVAYALSRVEVDENGNVVLNETAQTVLEQTFMDAKFTMDEQQVAELKAMVEAGLGGQAGAQAVEITEKFYRYSNAFREISDTIAMRGDPQSLRNDYEQIARLRRTHLGPELADQLYAREEQMTLYTLDVMAIQADPKLTPEERDQKTQELAAQYPDVMPNGGQPDDQTANQSTN